MPLLDDSDRELIALFLVILGGLVTLLRKSRRHRRSHKDHDDRPSKPP